MRTTIIILIVLALAACGGYAQDYRIDWSVISSGGGDSTGTGYKVSATVAQPTAGYAGGESLTHWIGFWIPEAKTEPPIVVPDIASAKALEDRTLVSISGKIATSAVGDFTDFFYIEESNRFSGIRIAASPSTIPELARGKVINVIGTMDTLPSGERQIAGPMVVVASSSSPPGPLGMPGRSIGGGDFSTPPTGQCGVTGGSGLNNVGLLIQTWGRVTATGAGYVELDDGSGPVRVDTSLLASQPAQDSYISVIGISSLYMSGIDRVPQVLPRDDGDVR